MRPTGSAIPPQGAEPAGRDPAAVAAGPTVLVDIVFPGQTNHHGTLFGGEALALMDKVAFIAATRHARRPLVTASCDRIDFTAPAGMGELVELTARLTRVGRRSLSVEVELVAEALVTGERRLCTRGLLTMVAPRGEGAEGPIDPLPADAGTGVAPILRMVEHVMTDQTDQYGHLLGGEALAAMTKAAFVAATRHGRAITVLASSRQIDFRSRVSAGEIIELVPRVKQVGRSSMVVEVQLYAESLLSGDRRLTATGEFVMVAVDAEHNAVRVPPLA